MSEQPQGEWTIAKINEFIAEGHLWKEFLADAINAALAAEREKRERLEDALELIAESAFNLPEAKSVARNALAKEGK